MDGPELENAPSFKGLSPVVVQTQQVRPYDTALTSGESSLFFDQFVLESNTIVKSTRPKAHRIKQRWVGDLPWTAWVPDLPLFPSLNKDLGR